MTSHLIFVVIVTSFIVIQGCHVYKHFEEDGDEGLERRKRRSLNESDVIVTQSDFDQHIEGMRAFFDNCISEKMNSSIGFITEVDFVILDSLWFLITDQFYCKDGADTAECWGQTIEELITEGDIRNKTKECITEYTEDVYNGNEDLLMTSANNVMMDDVIIGSKGKSSTKLRNYKNSRRVANTYHGIYNLIDRKLSKGYLRCWTCDNAASDADCGKKGKFQTCQLNENSCENVVRVYHQGVTITKRCKQKKSCQIAKKHESRQLYMKSSDEKCNLDEPGTVCRCCCYSDGCNYDALYCYPQQAPAAGDYVDSSLSPYADIYPSTKAQFEEQIVFSTCLQNKTQLTDRGLGDYDLQKLTSFVQIMTSTGNKEAIRNFNHRMWYTRFVSLTDPKTKLRADVQGCVDNIYFYPPQTEESDLIS